MRYRRLGRTGLQVSEIGLGGGGLRCSTTAYAVALIGRALELGINYIDTASSYGDSEAKVGIALEGRRKQASIATKLDARTARDARREFADSLARLRTDYVDVLHLHAVNSIEDLDRCMSRGGAWEAMQRAREEGAARFLGITGHRHEVLVEALKRDVFDVALFIMNVVERDAEKELIPLALARDIGMTVMKPLATGLVPAGLALRYLLTYPVATVLPSATRSDWLEEDVAAIEGPLSEAERAEAERWRSDLEHVRCRICSLCEPCPEGIKIGSLLGTYRFYNEFRSMGRQRFLAFPWGGWARASFSKELDARMAAIAGCTECGDCEPGCPHQLPIAKMLKAMLPTLRELKEITKSW